MQAVTVYYGLASHSCSFSPSSAGMTGTCHRLWVTNEFSLTTGRGKIRHQLVQSWVTAGWRCEAGRQEEGSTSLEAPESAPVVSGLWTGRFKITATLFMVSYITCGPKMRRKTMRIHCLLRLMGPSVFGWSSSEVSLGYADGSSWG